ncbi:MAG TPA: glycosyltransferase family 39 protein [Pyrinomonadaceae bacterium]|nr:glycosyltransferase family 39 protein [Pyrinomonadaceae bacterium]
MIQSTSDVEFEDGNERPALRPLGLNGSLLARALASARTIYLLILLNLAIAVPLAWVIDLFIDEAFSLHTTSKGIRYAFEQAVYFELQAPLYFVILNLWRAVNDSIFFARLFSVLCIAATIKIAALLSQRLFKTINPAWFAALVALHPYAVWASTQIRLYAFGILLSSLLLLLFHDGFLSDKRSRNARLAYLLVAVIALYTQYYLGFLLVGNAVALLCLRKWRSLFIYLAGMLLVGLCFIPMLLLVPGQVSTHTQSVKGLLPLTEALRTISWQIKGFLLPITAWDESGRMEGVRHWLFRLVYLLVLVALIRAVISSRLRNFLTTGTVVVWSVFITTTLFYIAVIRITGEDMLQERHSFALFIPSLLFAFSLLAKVADWRARISWLLVFLFFSAASLYYAHTPVAKDTVWSRTAAHIMEAEQPNQPILIFHAGNALTFAHYYKGMNVLVPIPYENRFDTYDVRAYVFKDEQQVNDALARLPGEHESLWLVTDGLCNFIDVDFNCQGLEDFVNKHYLVEEDKTSFNVRTRRLIRKPISIVPARLSSNSYIKNSS